MNVPAAGPKRLVIVGATGMVGKYALRYALENSAVRSVTSISRSKVGISHPKLTEVLHRDFADCSALKRAGICRREGIPPRITRSRPLLCNVQKASDFAPSDPRHYRSGMRRPRRDCCRGELARTRLCSPRLSCGVRRPTPLRYRRRGKKWPRPDPRVSPQVQNSLRNLDAEPL